jgi:hypothetical protein
MKTEQSVPKLRHIKFRHREITHKNPPLKNEQTTPGNYPEESIQHSEHGKSLKSRTKNLLRVAGLQVVNHFNRLQWAAVLHVSTELTVKNAAIRIQSLFRLCVSNVLKINNSCFLKQYLPIGFYNGSARCSLL